MNKIAELSEENAVGASASVFTEESTNNRIAMDGKLTKIIKTKFNLQIEMYFRFSLHSLGETSRQKRGRQY